MRQSTASSLLLALALAVPAAAQEEASTNPRVTLETSKGTIVLELFPNEAPETVKNFLSYVDSGFYEGTIFHRVIAGFMIQGGGFGADLKKKATQPPVKNEADSGLGNDRGTIAMARTGDPHSATAQFFINVVDNAPLNHTEKSARGWGYTVFGKVVEGMDVADAIAAVKTARQGVQANLPVETVTIIKAAAAK